MHGTSCRVRQPPPGTPAPGRHLGCGHGPGGGDRRRLRRPRLGAAAGQARARRDPGRGARARRRPGPGDRRRLHLGHRRPHAAARRSCATCSARPAGRWRRSSSSSSSTACASTGSTTAPSLVLPVGRAAQLEAFDGARPGLGQAVARPRRARTPTTGRCCAGATSRCPGRPTTCLARSPRGSTRARRCRSGSGASCATRGAAGRGVPLRGRRARPPRRARLGRPHGVPRAALRRVGRGRRDRRSCSRRWYAGWRRAASPSCRRGPTDVVVRDGRAVAVAHDGGRARRRRRGLRRRPAPAARAGAVRRAHDAGDPAGAVPSSGSRARCATCPTSWWCTATRCSWSAPAAGRPRVGMPGR